METQYFKQYSPSLNRDMEMKVYGHAGRPVLFIPCQNGRFYDFENFHMTDVWAPWIAAGRCMVPGVRRAFKRCPDRNSCARCPYGRSPDQKQPPVISLDSLLEDGYEEGSDDTTADPVVSSLYLDDVLRHLREENPVFLDIVYLRADGLTLDEISAKLSIPRTTLHRMLQKIRQIAENME